MKICQTTTELAAPPIAFTWQYPNHTKTNRNECKNTTIEEAHLSLKTYTRKRANTFRYTHSLTHSLVQFYESKQIEF